MMLQSLSHLHDASKSGLGAAVIQEGHPIAYASKSMTKSQTNYAQIEKELLAILFACEKFHDYIYGKRVSVETDHRPLITIYKKNAPARLQRMLLKLQQYSIDLIYKSGKDLTIADTLSRAYLEDTSNSEEEFEVLTVLPMTEQLIEQLQQETAEDPLMQLLSRYIHYGWPAYKKDVHPDVKPYHAFRDEMAEYAGIIYKGEKIVVPPNLRVSTWSKYTEATSQPKHPRGGPEMNNEIDRLTTLCQICNRCKTHQQKEPLKQHSVPERPWQAVATDIFTWKGKNHLVLVDAYSGWHEINTLDSIASTTVIKKLKSHFARFGIPDILYSNNGPQYSSTDYMGVVLQMQDSN